MKLLLLFWIFLSVLTATIESTNAVSLNPELYDKITELSYDFDTEQSKDHYDKQEHESESSQEDYEASCYVENYVEYKHGQKVSRTDPCETCICLDGEIFCWWKKCGNKKLLNENKKHKNNNNKLLSSSSHHKKQKINKEKRRKKFKLSKKNLRKFNHSIDQNYRNDNETQYSTDTSPSLSLSKESNNDSFLLTKINNNNNINKSSGLEFATTLPLINLKFNKPSSLFQFKKTKKNDKIKLSPKIIEIKSSKPENINENENDDDNDDDSDDYLENEELIISESSKTQQRVRVKTNDKKDDDDNNNISLQKHFIITTSDNAEDNDDVLNKNDILKMEDKILTNENILSKFENPYAITDNIDSVMNNKKKIKFMNTSKNEKMNKLSTIMSHLNLKHQQQQQQQEQSQKKNLNENQIKSTTIDETTEEHCIVMGKSYRIGTVLPQDTGNCLQCICIEGATKDEPPRVTCSPHNCPPLILPDLFDTTGY